MKIFFIWLIIVLTIGFFGGKFDEVLKFANRNVNKPIGSVTSNGTRYKIYTYTEQNGCIYFNKTKACGNYVLTLY